MHVEPVPAQAAAPVRQRPTDIVRFEAVQKSYDGRTLVVHDLDLGVERGEFLTLLGPSGSGKTTSLMMLAGFEVPTEGRIMIDGVDVTLVPPYRRGIGMVFQNYALFPHMTVAENITFPLTVRGISDAEIQSRVRRVLDMVNLGDFGARRPAQLSGGQQQRVALARSLVFEPALVLLDEPLGALDKQLRERMQYELKQIHEALGVTMIYVTHDQSEALTMSDRIAVFNDGRIQQLARPEDIYRRPANLFVAQFVGENNRLEGTVEAVQGGYCTVRLDDGSVVRAVSADVSTAGISACLTVRPERVVFEPDAEQGLVNVLKARVEKLIFLGDAMRVVLTVCDNAEFVVKLASGREPIGIHRGAQVRVGWQADDCRAYRVH